MDYVVSQVERIANELHESGVSIPIPARPPPQTSEIPQESEATTSESSRKRVYLPQWLRDHRSDPAATVMFGLYLLVRHSKRTSQGFMELLLDHLRERLSLSEENNERIFIDNDTLFEHPILNIKYTSYEVQQERDIIHVGYDRTGIMVYTPTLTEHGNVPWSYANVLAIYHLTARTTANPSPRTLTLLWVRWMERSADTLTGPNSRNYTRVSFVPSSCIAGSAFDFVDPSHVIRACHLIPAFDLGRTRELLDPSVARDREGDWCAFYANRFVDRDAFARFAGIGIGCQRFQASQPLDIQVGPDHVVSPLDPDLDHDDDEGEESEAGGSDNGTPDDDFGLGSG